MTGATGSGWAVTASVSGVDSVSESPDFAFAAAATPVAVAVAVAAPARTVFAEMPALPLSPLEASAASTPGVPPAPGTVPRQAPLA